MFYNGLELLVIEVLWLFGVAIIVLQTPLLMDYQPWKFFKNQTWMLTIVGIEKSLLD